MQSNNSQVPGPGAPRDRKDPQGQLWFAALQTTGAQGPPASHPRATHGNFDGWYCSPPQSTIRKRWHGILLKFVPCNADVAADRVRHKTPEMKPPWAAQGAPRGTGAPGTRHFEPHPKCRVPGPQGTHIGPSGGPPELPQADPGAPKGPQEEPLGPGALNPTQSAGSPGPRGPTWARQEGPQSSPRRTLGHHKDPKRSSWDPAL